VEVNAREFIRRNCNVGQQMKERLDHPQLAGLLCLFAGLVCLLTCLVYNQWLLALLDPSPPLAPETLAAIHLSQLVMVLMAATLLGAAWMLRRGRNDSLAARFFSSRLRVRLLLALLFGFCPLVLAELMARPVVPADNMTTIFVADKDLGWRLRAGVTDSWGGVPVTINNKGLCGPEVRYERTPAVPRILYLGDSVTFGYQLESYQQSFPYAIEDLLEDRLGTGVETVNGSVGGYSPWQHHEYLANEGMRYKPDLVVIGFILNDVTEKMSLVRFGGDNVGWQLAHSANTAGGWLARRLAIYRLGGQIYRRLQFGADPHQGAVAGEVCFVHDLVEKPQSPRVQEAWNTTLENLGRLTRFCQDKDLPVLLVAFPYTFQFADENRPAAPQQVLQGFAETAGVPLLDLLPAMEEYCRSHSCVPTDLFLDANHLSDRGSRAVATMIVEFLEHAAVPVGLPGLGSETEMQR
jgi:lysophospholipase L1-like esterase